MQPRRGALAAGVAVLCLPVLLASLAWACSPSKKFGVSGPGSGPPGGTVTITATALEVGPVEVRWLSADGARLPLTDVAYGDVYQMAGRDVRNFEANTVLPDVAPGTYHVVVIGPDSPGPDGPTANFSEPLEVKVLEPVGSVPAPAVEPQPIEDTTSVFEPADVPAPAQAAPATPAQAQARVSTPVRATATLTDEVVAAPAEAPAPAPAPPLVPSARAAGSDLWSGFAGERGAGLADSAPVPGTGQSAAAGLVVLGIGLVALVGGTAVALRRRPVKVTTQD